MSMEAFLFQAFQKHVTDSTDALGLLTGMLFSVKEQHFFLLL